MVYVGFSRNFHFVKLHHALLKWPNMGLGLNMDMLRKLDMRCYLPVIQILNMSDGQV